MTTSDIGVDKGIRSLYPDVADHNFPEDVASEFRGLLRNPTTRKSYRKSYRRLVKTEFLRP